MAQNRIHIAGKVLGWARERSGKPDSFFDRKFPDYDAWYRGDVLPTRRQMEQFAKATYTPIGYFFLQTPPEDKLPIPDFRTIGDKGQSKPSPNLLDMIYICQQRQIWYQEFAQRTGEGPCPFAGSASISDSFETVARDIRDALKFDLETRRKCPTWTEALRYFIEQVEKIGILVMRSGVVGNNNNRPLDLQEFRGFSLADPFAPLIFINSKDSKGAQMFTLAHELAHIWINQSALSDTDARLFPKREEEIWCNQVAAELLVPLHELQAEFRHEETRATEIQRLARHFKVSTLVILRRLFDSNTISAADFFEAYDSELAQIRDRGTTRSQGGDFYNTQTVRVGKRFAHALVMSTLEGHTLYRNAFQMLGIKKVETFNEVGRSLGIYI